MCIFNKKPKGATYKGNIITTFSNEDDKTEAAVDTFLWLRDYLLKKSAENDKILIKEVAQYFQAIPKEMKSLGMSPYQWLDFNNMLFFLVNVVCTSTKLFFFGELNQRVMARMIAGRFYGDDPVEHKKLVETQVDRGYIKEVIEAYDYSNTLCFNYWKYYE